MATGVAVLGVIRASRPVFRSAHDRVAFAVHASFLAAGYSLTGVGSQAAAAYSTSPSTPDTEVGIEGWNDLEDAYAFQYSGANQQGLSRSVIVKCTAIGDSLMVDSASSSDTDSPANLEIKVDEHTVAGSSLSGNYKEQYTDLEGLVDRVNSIISKLSPPPATATSSDANDTRGVSTAPPIHSEREIDWQHPRSNILEDRSRPSGFGYPELPVYGGDDLLPGAGGGIFAPRRDVGVGGGSMLVGPNDPRWGRIGVGPQPGSMGGLNPAGGPPPGARFDPFGPPGVPGFEPGRFTRDPRRPPGGGTHPDLEHFRPL